MNLGKYEIRGTLGRGAMGLVYDGWDPLIHRQVAIKTVRLAGADDEEATEGLARFRREAQAAGRLSHPNIVGVYDFGETDDVAYIVMEFVAGGSLKEVLDKREKLEAVWVCRIMSQVLAALAFSHARGVVHRDVKPANVMLSADGAVKLADFGIARIESSAMTSVGVVMGTPAYMAPEQFLGEPADARSDIYAAGAMAFHLLTGTRPYEGNPTAIMHKVLNAGLAPRASERLPGLPVALDPVLQRAMARQAEDRFQDAASFADAMNAALCAPVVAAEELDEERTVIMRPPAAQAPSPAKPAAPSAAAPEAAKSKSAFPLLPVIAAVAVLAAGSAGAWFFLSGPSPAPLLAPAPPPKTISQPAPGPLPSRPPFAAEAARQDPSTVAAAVNQVLTHTPCARATATPTATGLAISGITGAGGPEIRLRQAAAAASAGLDIVWSLKTFDAPYCSALDALGGTPIAPIVAIKEDPAHLPDGTHLHTIVSNVPFPAYIRVDYLSSDGGLAHLYPQVRDAAISVAHDDPSVLLPAGAALKLGYVPHWIFQVGPPFGTDMILVTAATEKLLPETRPNTEPAARYLADLHAALLGAASRGGRTASAVLVLNTAAK